MTGETKYMHQTKLSLLILTTLLATSLPAYANRPSVARLEAQAPKTNLIAQTATTTDLIGVGATLINSWINPPSRSAEITADAEVKKAKIAADADIAKEKLRIEASKSEDKVTPVLDKWGVARTNCAPDTVFITGITTDTVCVQPNTSLTSGYYTYDRTKQQLVRTSNNSQTVQTVQTTRVSTSAKDSGF
jgi:hypothetical protein